MICANTKSSQGMLQITDLYQQNINICSRVCRVQDGFPNVAQGFCSEMRPFVGFMTPFFDVDKYETGFHSEVQANVCALLLVVLFLSV